METRFVSVMKNLIIMLKERGFKVPKQIYKFDYSDKSITDFVNIQKGSFLCLNKKKEKVFVFISNEKAGVKELRIKISQIKKLKIKHAIFALETKESSYSKNLEIENKDIKFQRYLFDELQINSRKHELVPKHVLLSNEEATIVKKLFLPEKMPAILNSDPQCKYQNACPGDIMKIYRPDCIYYRIVTSKKN